MKISRVGAVALCLLALSVAPAFAQSPAAGVEVGLSMSRVSPDPAGQSFSRAPGALVGGWVLLQPWVPVGIQIEAVYAQKNTHLSSSQDLKLDYFEVPVLARLKLFKTIYMLEGISLGFPVSAKVSSASSDNDIKSTIQSPDIGMVIAGGVPLAPKVSVEFRYEGGFKKISNVSTAGIERNRSLSGIIRIKLAS